MCSTQQAISFIWPHTPTTKLLIGPLVCLSHWPPCKGLPDVRFVSQFKAPAPLPWFLRRQQHTIFSGNPVKVALLCAKTKQGKYAQATTLKPDVRVQKRNSSSCFHGSVSNKKSKTILFQLTCWVQASCCKRVVVMIEHKIEDLFVACMPHNQRLSGLLVCLTPFASLLPCVYPGGALKVVRLHNTRAKCK